MTLAVMAPTRQERVVDLPELLTMRRSLSLRLAVLAGFLLPATLARAAVCPSRTIFDVTALQSEMMLLATDCHDSAQYNAFMRRYQPGLFAAEQSLHRYFLRRFGRGGQAAQDRFVTNLANAQSDAAIAQGSDFCPRNAALFAETASLQAPDQLPLYAAGKDALPSGVVPCTSPASRRR
ncbi:MAG: hypothetical protein ACP5NP_04940 [Acetobacteraceae bacterium]